MAPLGLSNLGAIFQGWHSLEGHRLSLHLGAARGDAESLSHMAEAGSGAGVPGMPGGRALRRGGLRSGRFSWQGSLGFCAFCFALGQRDCNNSKKKALGKGSCFSIYCSTGGK